MKNNNPEAAKACNERGIKPATAQLCQLRDLTAAEHAALLQNKEINVPAIGIPYFGIDGQPSGFYRTKVLGDYTPKSSKKPAKYLQRAGTPSALFFPPNADCKALAADVTQPLNITEGEFKAIKACQEGVPTVALGGVNSWRRREDDDSSAPIEDLNLIKWEGRRVYICFDSDAATNPRVQRAQTDLAKELFRRGADPRIVKLPHLTGQTKTGLDDWLTAKGAKGRAWKKEWAELLHKADSPCTLRTTSSVDIVATKYKDPEYIIPGFMPAGLLTLNGPPKVRKSFLALAVAQAIASGGRALGAFDTRPGPVLFNALEDTPRRIKSRLEMMGLAPSPNLHFSFAQDLQRGDEGCSMLVRWCEQHPGAKLIVIDTLQKFRTPTSGRQNAYETDYAALSAIKNIADRFGLAILLVHHLRKGDADDVYERVSGSTAITGTADTNMVLLRERGSDDGFLHITGRDIEEQEVALRFESGLWKVLGDARRYRASAAQQEIIDAIKANNNGPMTPSQIGAMTGRKRTSLPKLLHGMVENGLLDWLPGGKYGLGAAVAEAETTPTKY